MLKAFKYRIYPTKTQIQLIESTLVVLDFYITIFRL